MSVDLIRVEVSARTSILDQLVLSTSKTENFTGQRVILLSPLCPSPKSGDMIDHGGAASLWIYQYHGQALVVKLNSCYIG